MTEEEISQLKHLLTSAVEAAYAEPDLLRKNDGSPREGNEQTIAFRAGIHLHELVKGTQYQQFYLDCEYNKHGDDRKKLDESLIRPDLLIHRRGPQGPNIRTDNFSGFTTIPRFELFDIGRARQIRKTERHPGDSAGNTHGQNK